MKIAVFGAGGIGGLVGGALARVHPETFFYVRGKNLETIRRDGLQIQSPTLGEFTVRPCLATNQANEIGKADIIILTCKGCNLEEACRAIRPMIGSDTVVLTLLNGVGVTDILAPLLPACILADGVIRVSSRLAGPGHILHESSSCSIAFARKDGRSESKLEALAHLLCEAGLSAEISSCIQLDCWLKYASMSSNSVAYLYFDGPAGTVRQYPEYQTILRGIIEPLTRVAEFFGTKLPDALIERYLSDFDQFPAETTTSLYRDLKNGFAPEHTELYHIVGRLIEWGVESEIPLPYHREVYSRYSFGK